MMWAAMQHCAAKGASVLHLGRTSLGNEGLRRFKVSLGASEETVPYCRYDFASNKFVSGVDRAEGWFNHVFDACLRRFCGWLARFSIPIYLEQRQGQSVDT